MGKPSRRLPETEQRSPRSRDLDQRSTEEIVRAIFREDASITRALRRELPVVSRAAEMITSSLGHGGRLLYVGAGTSGRIAALDAAECPPTFGVPEKLVRAVVAGGRRALTRAVEGAEDSAVQGMRDLKAQRITKRDVVVGITASGGTPYVIGALEFARKRGVPTIGVTANRRSPIVRAAEITIAVETGPEIIAGSTRLKAGTAQKMVLNMLSTASMVRLGRVYSHWMIGVALSNRKLRRRGLHILEEASGASPKQATRALRQAGNDLPVALVMLKGTVNAPEARRRLHEAGGKLRRALREDKATSGKRTTRTAARN